MSGIRWDDEQLEEAGIDKVELKKLVSKLKSCSRMMQRMGLQVYGESGDGYLIHESRPEHDERTLEADFGAIVADVGPGFDGGGW